MEFGKLTPLISHSKINDAIAELLKQKAISNEKYFTDQVELLNLFIEEQLSYCDSKKHLLANREDNPDELNDLFRQLIGLSK